MSLVYGINPRESGVVRIDLPRLFGNENPVILEIGSGKGRFLVDSGRSKPDLNFLGIEKSLHYFRVIERRLRHWGVTNARIINFEAERVLAEMLAPSSIREVHIYFPDPWPKKKRQKRRLITEETLRVLASVIEPGGRGVYVTDHKAYFEAAVPVFREVFECEWGEVLDDTPPRTNYEAKYREEGRPIYQVSFGVRQ